MKRMPSRTRHHHATVLEPLTTPRVEEITPVPMLGSANLEQTEPVAEPRKIVVSWAALIWLTLVHIAAVAAFWTFSWSGLALVFLLHWVTGSLGICLGYHRLLTHTGFETPTWMRRTLAVVGVLAGEGGPLTWTANHRKHHAFSDQPGDPHSPHDGPWWSHMFWLAVRMDDGDPQAFFKKWVPDLMKDKFLMSLESWFLPIHIALGAVLTGAGYLIGGLPLAMSWLVYGVFVRMVFVLHSTWFVNSASHMWGYKNYETRDDSRNLWWVAILAYGEGWHNNHHAHPRLAQHGHRWWEFDWTYGIIRLMRLVGLAKNVEDLKSLEDKNKKRSRRKAA
jgi:fatty-acid desaturase